MNEAIKKTNQTSPESYSPKTPELLNMIEKLKTNNTEVNKMFNEKSSTELPMKKLLDFNIRYNSLSNLTFIQRFASVYMFLENIDGSGDIYCKDENPCFGCGGASCKKPMAVNKQAPYAFLFEAMSGKSVLRLRFDGQPTEIQKLIGDTEAYGNECGTDYTVDFLFGYIGYEYRKCSDNIAFKNEIIASINAGKPVIASVKSGNPRFYLITGYDNDTLLCPDYCYVTYKDGKNILSDKPEEPPVYDELEFIYIIGAKTTPRYTLKDGMENIRRVLECNINENVWDDCLAKVGDLDKFSSDDGLKHINPAEIKSSLNRIRELMSYKYNAWNFRKVFNDCSHERLSQNDLYKELSNPVFSELCKKINTLCGAIVSNSHKIWKINADCDTITLSELTGVSAKICGLIKESKKNDMKLLGYINQAIEIIKVKTCEI